MTASETVVSAFRIADIILVTDSFRPENLRSDFFAISGISIKLIMPTLDLSPYHLFSFPPTPSIHRFRFIYRPNTVIYIIFNIIYIYIRQMPQSGLKSGGRGS